MPLLIAMGAGALAGVALGRLSCLVVSPSSTVASRAVAAGTAALAVYGGWKLARDLL